MSDTPRYDALRERAIADPGRHEALDVWEALKAAERENAALRKAQAEVFKIAMDCINGRISDVEALQLLEAQAPLSQGKEPGNLLSPVGEP